MTVYGKGRDSTFAGTIMTDKGARDPDDCHVTHPRGTTALIAAERFRRGSRVWEPACGTGAISKVLIGAGCRVVSSDLVNHGYRGGAHGVDFLETIRRQADILVTNPPFKHDEAFLHHALALGVKKICLLLRLTWLEGGGRGERVFGGATPLARVHVFSARLPTHRKNYLGDPDKAGMMALAWYVWERGHIGPIQTFHV